MVSTNQTWLFTATSGQYLVMLESTSRMVSRLDMMQMLSSSLLTSVHTKEQVQTSQVLTVSNSVLN